MLMVGIDPGLDGGIAVLGDEGLLRVTRTPTISVGKKREYDLSTMIEALPSTFAGNSVAFLERTHAMPKQGVVSMYKMGEGFGVWLGILAALRIPYTLVAPQTWKAVMLRDMSVRDKKASLLRAQQLWSDIAKQIGKHHGMAEAALIAEYGRRKMAGASQTP